VGSGYGTGAVTAGNILAGNVTFKTAWTRKFPVDAGILYFHTAVYTGMEITGELTMENQISGTYGAAGSAGQIEKWRAQQPQLLRMAGPAARSRGTTVLTKLFQVDLPIVWDSFDKLGDIDGNDIRVGKFTSKYNAVTTNAAGAARLVHDRRQGTRSTDFGLARRALARFLKLNRDESEQLTIEHMNQITKAAGDAATIPND
jgi:hypothetical protein